jgi:carboxypeptidase A2
MVARVAWVVLLLQLAASCSAAEYVERKDYSGYKVLEIVPQDIQSVERLRALSRNDEQLDFWNEPSFVGDTVRVMVPPTRVGATLHALENFNIPYTTRTENMQEVTDQIWSHIYNTATPDSQSMAVVNNFLNLTEIYSYMNALVSQCRPDLLCEVVNLGNSFLNHPIYSFRISKESGSAPRRAYYVDGTTHAREWLSTTTALNILNALATGSNADALRLTDLFDWHIVPVVNPDGYEYSWTSDRYWRKNRRANGACVGTDINRNFDSTWGTDGASTNPCSDTFRGSSAASEPETQVIQRELRRIASTIRGVFTIHSYSSLWLFPWGYTVNHDGQVCARAGDHVDLMRVADVAANAVQATYNTVWRRGNACETIYPTSGTTDAYAKGVAGIKYTFTLELRGNDFVVNASEIIPCANEVWNGLVAAVEAIQ